MKVTDKQLDEYIELYKSEYGIELERTRALSQLHKLINLTLYMAMSAADVTRLEEALEKGYTDSATLRKIKQEYNEG